MFSVLTGLISIIAALGSSRSLVRFAKLVQPVVLGTLGLFLLFALTSIDYKNLLPVTTGDALPVLAASLPVIDAVGVVLCFSCFLEGSCEYQPRRFRSYALWLIPMLVIFLLLNVAVIGRFGAELTSLLTFPFFTIVRNFVFFNALERLEALIVSLWLFPDFLLVSALLYSAQHCLRCLLGEKPGVPRREPLRPQPRALGHPALRRAQHHGGDPYRAGRVVHDAVVGADDPDNKPRRQLRLRPDNIYNRKTRRKI